MPVPGPTDFVCFVYFDVAFFSSSGSSSSVPFLLSGFFGTMCLRRGALGAKAHRGGQIRDLRPRFRLAVTADQPRYVHPPRKAHLRQRHPACLFAVPSYPPFSFRLYSPGTRRCLTQVGPPRRVALSEVNDDVEKNPTRFALSHHSRGAGYCSHRK